MLERRHVLLTFPFLIVALAFSGCRGDSGGKRVVYDSTRDRPAMQPVPSPGPTTRNNLAEDFENRVERLERKKIEAVQSRYRVDCESNVYCGDSVGMLVTSGDSHRDPELGVGGRCTAFLVGERYVMTNHHCISIGTNLSMTLLFPETSRFPAENIRVSRVMGSEFSEHFSLVDDNYQDLALLELDRATSRPSMRLSGKSLKAGDAVTAVVVDPVETGGLSRIKSCRVSGGGLIDGEFDEERRYRQVVLRDCPIVPGNSGSMILDAAGDVVAVLYGSLNPEKIYSPESPVPATWRDSLVGAPFSMANRMGCLSESFLALARVRRVDQPECESFLYANRDEFFTDASPLQPLRDRKTSYTFVDGPEDPKFKDGRISVARLMIPGCADSPGSFDFDAPVLVRSFEMDAQARVSEIRNQAQGARPVKITVKDFIEIEGNAFAPVEVYDGSPKKAETLITRFYVPVLGNVTPHPVQ